MKICRAILDTNQYAFEAYGSSHGHALRTLIGALQRHAAQARIPLEWWEDFADQIQYREIETGKAYRDREPL